MKNKYFDKYIGEFIDKYKLTETEKGLVFSKERIDEFIHYQKNIHDYFYNDVMEKEFYDSIKAYFEECIYRDKYGIFDWFSDKIDATIYINNLYFFKEYTFLNRFLGANYSFLDTGKKISKYEMIKETLEYLFIHVKRGNIKIRILSDDMSITIVEYTYKNSENFLNDIIEKYNDSKDKDFFIEYLVHIILNDNNW